MEDKFFLGGTMSRIVMCALMVIATLLCAATMIPYALAKERTFHGRVIDYDTKEPIEGAVVVASWDEAMPTLAGEATRFKDVKEILTDKDGEWTISGEEGKPHTEHPYFHFITGAYYTRTPTFIIFKPGYCSWPNGFSIEACKRKLKPEGNNKLIEGEDIELPRLTNREDRIRAQRISGPAGEIPPGKLDEFYRLINEERRALGLKEIDQ